MSELPKLPELPKIPRYDLVEEVGSGGMSVVYRARDSKLDREVAVKVLHRHLAGRDTERARFRQEAQAVAKLSHPNILKIHDYSGEDTREAWIVSEFIRGPTLRAFGESIGFGLPEIGALVAERLSRALAHAHHEGIIHRDLKPENVMVQDDGTIKLTDFGIAKMVNRDTRMTMTGTLLGSPAHMPPEIIEGKGCDERGDIFSLGTVLYWLCCGSLPFSGESPAEVLRVILEGRYEDPQALDPRVCDELAGIIKSTMQHERAQRPQSADAVAEALTHFLEGLGLEQPEDELKAFFADPSAYKAELKDRLVERWQDRAQRAMKARQVADAISACNLLLALRPADPIAEGILRRVKQRRSLLRGAAALAGLVALVGLTVSLFEFWPSPASTRLPLPPAADTRVAAQSLPTPGLVVLPPAHAKPQRPTAPKSDPTHSLPRGNRSPVAVAAPTKPSSPRDSASTPKVHAAARVRVLRILVDPYATIMVDQQQLAIDREAKTTLEVGRHQVSLRRRGFLPIEASIRVTAGATDQELRYRLEPRPATLKILNNQRAVLSLGDKLIGPIDGSREVPVTFPLQADGRYTLEQVVEISLQKPGFTPFTKTLKLRPGQGLTLPISLSPSA